MNLTNEYKTATLKFDNDMKQSVSNERKAVSVCGKHNNRSV